MKKYSYSYFQPSIFIAKYVVGGGMSEATARRKYIVHIEGNIPIKRTADSEVTKPFHVFIIK